MYATVRVITRRRRRVFSPARNARGEFAKRMAALSAPREASRGLRVPYAGSLATPALRRVCLQEASAPALRGPSLRRFPACPGYRVRAGRGTQALASFAPLGIGFVFRRSSATLFFAARPFRPRKNVSLAPRVPMSTFSNHPSPPCRETAADTRTGSDPPNPTLVQGPLALFQTSVVTIASSGTRSRWRQRLIGNTRAAIGNIRTSSVTLDNVPLTWRFAG